MLLLSFASNLYTWILGDHPSNDPSYEGGIFTTILFTLVTTTLLIALLFYLVINRMRAGFNRLFHWLLVLVVIGLLNGVIAMFYAKNKTGVESLDSYMYMLGLVNMVYAMILFFAFSWILKRFSIFARYIPF